MDGPDYCIDDLLNAVQWFWDFVSDRPVVSYGAVEGEPAVEDGR